MDGCVAVPQAMTDFHICGFPGRTALALALLWSFAPTIARTEGLALTQIAVCKLVKDSLARLACFDLATGGTTAPVDPTKPDPPAGPVEKDVTWDITTYKSPVDDAPQISGILQSDDGKTGLVLRCKENTTDALVVMEDFLGVSGRVMYRINDNKAVETMWSPSTDGRSLFAWPPSKAIALINALSDDGIFFIRVFDNRGNGHDAKFNLGGVSDLRNKIASTCSWPSSQLPGVSRTAPEKPKTAPAKPKAAPAIGAPSNRPSTSRPDRIHQAFRRRF
jgi:hypothetical protein